MRHLQGKTHIFTLLSVLLLILTSASPGTASPGPTSPPVRMTDSLAYIPAGDADKPVRLIVELPGAPLADDNRYIQSIRIANEQAALRSQLQRNGIAYREWGAFQKLLNGVVISVPFSEIGKVSRLPGVKRVHLSRKVNPPVPELYASVEMIGAKQAWAGDPALAIPGVDGSGVTVAVLDTGIDYTHPDLGGCIGPDCKVVFGYDFVGDTFNGVNDPVPDADPMDQRGHGTHVAGIIAARSAGANGVTGVAPGASLISLKIFGPVGSTWDDIILAALEAAYDLKVDVVNLSVGAGFLWPESPTAAAVTRLSQKGVFVASSAGNNGDAGEFATGAPAVGTGAVAAASVDNDLVMRPTLFDPAGTPIGYDVMVESPDPPASGQSPELVYVGLGATDADFLNNDGTSKVQGKVALISRGIVSFMTKSLLAQKHGAVQAIVFNNQPGSFLGTLQVPGDYIPTISITQGDGQRLLALMAAGPVQITWSDELNGFPTDTPRQISTFSSWGPAPDLSVKPDITTPGGYIYSTYPVSMGSYATMSGTSMASPHLAGAAALLLDARREMFGQGSPKVKVSALQTLLMNTATPLTDGPDSTDLYPVHRQGAGLLDVWRAIGARQRVLPEKIALGEQEGGSLVAREVTIENLGTAEESYTFAATGAAGGPAVAVTAGDEPLTVKPGRTGKTHLTLTVPDNLPDDAIFSGWLQVKNSAGEVIAHIPYLGYKGDYQAATTLDPMPPFNFPWLAQLWGPLLYKVDAMEIYPDCECDSQAAWVVFSLARHARMIRVEIWESETERKWGNVFEMEYLWRSAGGIELFGWNGTNDKGRRVPPGTYELRLRILKPLGDPKNPEHWDEWISGPITVIY